MTSEPKPGAWQRPTAHRDRDDALAARQIHPANAVGAGSSTESGAGIPRGKFLQPSVSTKRVQRLTVTALPVDNKSALAREGKRAIPELPTGAAARRHGMLILFVLTVFVPIVLATIYYGYFASRQYVSEFRFTVTDTSSPTNTGQTLMAALGGGGSSANNYVVVDYLTSLQVIDDLQKQIRVIELYSKPDIDWWSRFNSSLPIEDFLKYWQNMVTAKFDMTTGTTVTQVRAFSAQDALVIANAMAGLAEKLVNDMSFRSRDDAVLFAEKQVAKARERLLRVRSQVIDERQKTVGAAGPDKNGGGNREPAGGAAATQGANKGLLLDMERQFAQTDMTSTMQSLDLARSNAAAQHLYIMPYVRPSLAQSSTYPDVFWSIAKVGGMAFSIWLIGLLTLRSIFERFY